MQRAGGEVGPARARPGAEAHVLAVEEGRGNPRLDHVANRGRRVAGGFCLFNGAADENIKVAAGWDESGDRLLYGCDLWMGRERGEEERGKGCALKRWKIHTG